MNVASRISKKKDGTIRFCIDFRKLNAVYKKDSYPLPRIDDIFDQLSSNAWYSCLNLKSGYWQIKIWPAETEKRQYFLLETDYDNLKCN